jgi:protein-tyrosine phosphatase
MTKSRKILFVCLGNICRSPSAEAIFNHKIRERQLDHMFETDSAGLHGYHSGEKADARMISHAQKRGYSLDSISRKITKNDLKEFDLIVAMDDSNIDGLKSISPDEYKSKICKITDFLSDSLYSEVPDPYYGGYQGFENVLDILEYSVDSLIDTLVNK